MSWIRDVALLVVAVALFVSGLHFGRASVEAEQVTPLRKQLAENMEQMGRYEQQLSAARRQHQVDQAAIDAAAARPVPRIVCRAAAPVPAVPAPADHFTNRPGLDSDVLGPEYEPGPAVHAVAVQAARALEACYADLDTWPR